MPRLVKNKLCRLRQIPLSINKSVRVRGRAQGEIFTRWVNTADRAVKFCALSWIAVLIQELEISRCGQSSAVQRRVLAGRGLQGLQGCSQLRKYHTKLAKQYIPLHVVIDSEGLKCCRYRLNCSSRSLKQGAAQSSYCGVHESFPRIAPSRGCRSDRCRFGRPQHILTSHWLRYQAPVLWLAPPTSSTLWQRYGHTVP